MAEEGWDEVAGQKRDGEDRGSPRHDLETAREGRAAGQAGCVVADTEEPAERALSQMNEVLNRSVEELELSVRSYNCLKNANIQTIGDLVQKSEAEMLRTKNFGRKSLNEIKEILSGLGLTFGMKFDAQGRLISPSGAPAQIGTPLSPSEYSIDTDVDDDEEDEEEVSPAVE